jgi:predicted GNAT family acetyltransferase
VPASRADLYLGRDGDGVVAQIENVLTDPPARGHGLARGVVTAAVRLALDSGATCVFLVADADDWPRELYARLGFVPVAGYTELTRAPRR